MSSLRRWRGLAALVGDAVEHGSRAIERVQKETANRTFSVLEAIPVVALPARAVHVVHDAGVSAVYGTIRVIGRGLGATVDVALAAADAAREQPEPGDRSAGGTGS